jgi:hypothetical protein
MKFFTFKKDFGRYGTYAAIRTDGNEYRWHLEGGETYMSGPAIDSLYELEQQKQKTPVSMSFDAVMSNKSIDYIQREIELVGRVSKLLKKELCIKNVIFNDPATIVFWADGSKTVVQCQKGDKFDPEKGLAMAIAKKALGNKGNYCDKIKKWTDKYVKPKKKSKANKE